jgi:16S rRNA (cytidine1402-2'-O)-methyltransferase
LKDAREILGEREAVVARELTKLHEEIVRGRLSDLADKFSAGGHEPRGEIVVVVDRNLLAEAGKETRSEHSVSAIVARFEAEGLDGRSALKKSARQLGISRDEAYRRLTAERSREKL